MSTPERAISILTGAWRADVVHSSVGFEVQYKGIDTFGGLPYMGVSTFSGTVEDFEATLADHSLSGSAQIASMLTDDESVKGALLSPDFLDAERHPTVSFSGTATRSEGAQVEFEGEITIKGVAQPATFTGTLTGPVADSHDNERFGLLLTTTIDRTKFGITWNAPMPDGSQAFADEVTLEADLSLLKA